MNIKEEIKQELNAVLRETLGMDKVDEIKKQLNEKVADKKLQEVIDKADVKLQETGKAVDKKVDEAVKQLKQDSAVADQKINKMMKDSNRKLKHWVQTKKEEINRKV